MANHLGLNGGFFAKLGSSKLLMQLLKAIHFKDEATFLINNNGLKVTVEDAKSFQANAFVQMEVFPEYTLTEPEMTFNVSLAPVLECLNLLGSSSSSASASSTSVSTTIGSGGAALVLHYPEFGEPLRLWLEEDGVVSEASIKTKEAQENIDFNFCKAKVSAKLIIVSEHIRDIFNELDSSSEVVEFKVCPHTSTLKISTFGTMAHYSAEIQGSSDMFSHFQVEEAKSARYRLSLLKHGLKPISLSEKVSLRIDHRDFLCLQYLVKFNEGTCFIEFYCAPEEEEHFLQT